MRPDYQLRFSNVLRLFISLDSDLPG